MNIDSTTCAAHSELTNMDLSDLYSTQNEVFVKKRILDILEKVLGNPSIEHQELIFNLHSVEFYPKIKKVYIYNDVAMDTPPLILDMEKLYFELKNDKDLKGYIPN
jgi:hypothetical protein